MEPIDLDEVSPDELLNVVIRAVTTGAAVPLIWRGKEAGRIVPASMVHGIHVL